MYGKILVPAAPAVFPVRHHGDGGVADKSPARPAARGVLIWRYADLLPALAGRIDALLATMKEGIAMHGHPDGSRERLQRWALYLALLIMPGGLLIMPAVLWRMGQRKAARSAS